MSLLDPKFIVIAFAVVCLLPALRGWARHVVFLGANLAFIGGLLLAPLGTREEAARCFAAYLGFALLGYVFVRGILWKPQVFAATLIAYVLLFAYLQNYAFMHWFLPAGVIVKLLSTIGLSYLFFKVVHVMVEAKSGTLGAFDFPTYANYSLNFTTFIMGPIQRYQDFSAQWHGRTEAVPLEFEAHLNAGLRILLGMTKAYVLAPFIQPYALAGVSDIAAMTRWEVLLGLYAFYAYLYLNFSGYCDVVIGLGSLFGVRPPENFDKPFLSRNVSEFWLRMHRSLTTWLTDYIFSPMYKRALTSRWFGSRPLLSMNIAVLVTMVIAGVWHGPTMSFLLFGVVHGLYQVIYRTWDALLTAKLGRQKVRQFRQRWSVQAAGMFLTFNAVSLAFVFFQLDTDRAFQSLARLGGL